MINPTARGTGVALGQLAGAGPDRSARPDAGRSAAEGGPAAQEPARPDGRVQATDEAADARSLKKTAALPDVSRRELSIRVSPETGRVVIQVLDSDTKAVVRQIPPEEALDLLRHLPQKRAVFVDREG